MPSDSHLRQPLGSLVSLVVAFASALPRLRHPLVVTQAAVPPVMGDIVCVCVFVCV
jgi:hypothetical protein